MYISNCCSAFEVRMSLSATKEAIIAALKMSGTD